MAPTGFGPLIVFLTMFVVAAASGAQPYPHYVQGSLQLPSGIVGGESIAFDADGQGPYISVSDGSVYKYKPHPRHPVWVLFAASPLRPAICHGHHDPNLEPTCGRPLGIQFDKYTGDLYIADAYKGLLKVGKNGGVATQLASTAIGGPFKFTNSLDIDQDARTVYFTDTSTRFQRRQYFSIIATNDTTGRFMTYDIKSGKVTVLMKDLSFANGVALSQDRTYVLIAESTKHQIIKYWLKGHKAKTREVICQLPGAPDNINRNNKGQFWVGLNNGKTKQEAPGEVIATRINGEGHILEYLYSNGFLHGVSGVEEHQGALYVGSVELPFIGISKAY